MYKDHTRISLPRARRCLHWLTAANTKNDLHPRKINIFPSTLFCCTSEVYALTGDVKRCPGVQRKRELSGVQRFPLARSGFGRPSSRKNQFWQSKTRYLGISHVFSAMVSDDFDDFFWRSMISLFKKKSSYTKLLAWNL